MASHKSGGSIVAAVWMEVGVPETGGRCRRLTRIGFRWFPRSKDVGSLTAMVAAHLGGFGPPERLWALSCPEVALFRALPLVGATRRVFDATVALLVACGFCSAAGMLLDIVSGCENDGRWVYA
jgi:hypothetical protein